MLVALWLKFKNSFHDKFKAPFHLLTNNLGILPQRIIDFSERAMSEKNSSLN